ncbi:MAG: DUF3703 domain-containing protein [Pseudomonadota bacterium]
MSNPVKLAFKAEMATARAARLTGDLELAVHHLERAHIIGQRYFFAHLITHLHMLRIAARRAQFREIGGQLTRLLAVGPGYLSGWVPVGNPGSARVSAIKPMPVPDDLQVHFKGYSLKREMGIWAALFVLVALTAAGLALLRHANGVAAVEQAWKTTKVARLADFGSTKSLEIIPLVNWHAQSGKFKTEAGVSYLVKTDRNTILFDVGWNALREDPSPLQHNMRELGVALSHVDTIFLSHAHRDHTGGQDWVDANTFSLGKAQVDLRGKRVFAPVPLTYPGVAVTTIAHPAPLLPGVASTGPIARRLFMGLVEEQALVINVEGKGLVVIVGCGHQTLPKLVKRLEEAFGVPVYGLVGDVHYPVPQGRLFAGGLDLQKRFASGNGFFSPITIDDINADMALLEKKKLGILALGSHDTSDEAIVHAERRFGDAFHRVSVGTPIRIGHRSKSMPLTSSSRPLIGAAEGRQLTIPYDAHF